MTLPTSWVLTDGTVGMVNQAQGFAEAMGLKPELRTFRARAPWRDLAPQFWLMPHWAATPESDPIGPPWPDVIVACGSKSIPVRARSRRTKSYTAAYFSGEPTRPPHRLTKT